MLMVANRLETETAREKETETNRMLRKNKKVSVRVLDLRRLHFDLVWCYKILFGHVDMKSENFIEWAPHLSTRVISTNYTRKAQA